MGGCASKSKDLEGKALEAIVEIPPVAIDVIVEPTIEAPMEDKKVEVDEAKVDVEEKAKVIEVTAKGEKEEVKVDQKPSEKL
ncbi:hypothetical protein Cni_G06918 [Canna indica]|uniref:Uncharacterized protein n=1 Tax=Canna indica TaxID=4628 RepID=A0AAQ3JXU2_9LILI|nr:hypothetical protein Cni_G06918 [Canna indica]